MESQKDLLHDINNSLTALMLAIEVVSTHETLLCGDPVLIQSLQTIKSASKSLVQQIKRLNPEE